MKRVIDEDRLHQALHFLATTDELIAQLKAEVSRKEYAGKLARAKVFLTSEGSVEARKATAEVSEDVQGAEGCLYEAILAFEKLKAKRATEELIVEVFRTLEASRRQGNV